MKKIDIDFFILSKVGYFCGSRESRMSIIVVLIYNWKGKFREEKKEMKNSKNAFFSSFFVFRLIF